MKNNKKAISLIVLVITIAVLIIIATITLQNGLQRTDDARIAKHNADITMAQEEVESYYYSNGSELPVADLTPYPIPAGSSLSNEISKNNEQGDNFYLVNLSKLGKTADGNEATNDIYAVSATRHNVYYVKGTEVEGRIYHGLITKNDIKLTPVYVYNNPVVPIGFTYVGTETWDSGFTIQDTNGNQFVWVPVLTPEIQANGTLDGVSYNNKFGRRNFRFSNGDTFSATAYNEANDTTLQYILGSVNKYGGFYIAKYEASSSDGTSNGKAQSKANATSWINIDWYTSKSKAESMDTDWGWDTSVESYLCYGANWDTALEWLIDSGAKTSSQVTADSVSWGNYNNASFTYGTGSTSKPSGSSILINTGISTTPADRHMAKGIYDLAGNLWEWTMESYSNSYRVYRGGNGYSIGSTSPSASRKVDDPLHGGAALGFRTVLYIK